jgi:hypothetical protein
LSTAAAEIANRTGLLSVIETLRKHVRKIQASARAEVVPSLKKLLEGDGNTGASRHSTELGSKKSMQKSKKRRRALARLLARKEEKSDAASVQNL